ncbi:methyltransferase domain-containing protein [Demetria terragena]|uniref:methyltransferase domain-containing protein n=1 Tax=Demetria terragena TaxID=63959 RepID=UPI00037FACF5|nr:methyltransferase domain-containing protein [Demetria terragena]
MATEHGLPPSGIVRDTLLLYSLKGALDYLVEDLRSDARAHVEVLRRWPDALLVAYDGELAALADNRYFSACAVWTGERTSGSSISSLPDWPVLQKSRQHGLLSLVQQDGAGFRVGPLGDERWAARDAVVERWGWDNAPKSWVVNFDDFDGYVVAQFGPLFQTSRFGELERVPASTTPVIAGVLTRLAKAGPEHRLLDPFCGAGTNLVVAAEVSAAKVVGTDLNLGAVQKARRNCVSRGVPATLSQADAARLPFPDSAFDRVIANLPFGKRVGSHQENATLYPRFLRELDRVMTGPGRAILLTEDKRLLEESIQRTRGLRIIKRIVLESGGAHPTAYVAVRARGQQRRRN